MRGHGSLTLTFENERPEVVMAAKRPDFRTEWAVLDSNQRPWD